MNLILKCLVVNGLLWSFLHGSLAYSEESDGNIFHTPVGYTTKKLERIFKLRGKAHRWEHIVRGFRKEHHFSVIGSAASGEWRFQRYGDAVNDVQRSSGYELRLRYEFHIPLYKSFGYFLGSGFGAQKERSADSRLQNPKIIKLPGITGGFVWNLSPVVRLKSGMELYLERWDGLGLETGPLSKQESVSVTTRVVSLFAAIDIFYDLYYAVGFEYSQKKNHYLKPEKAANQRVNADLEKVESTASLVMTYHLM